MAEVTLVRSEINARFKAGETRKEIADSLGISVSSLYRFLESKKKTHTLEPRGPKLGDQIQQMNAALQGGVAPALLPAVKKLVRAMRAGGVDAFEIDLRNETFSVRGTQTFRIPEEDE